MGKLNNANESTPKPADEAMALAAALAGEHKAFQSLVDPYARELHVHCYRMLGSVQDAEDASQETILRAWRHLASFESRSSVRAWLYRIATNVCLTRRTRSKAEPAAALDVSAAGIDFDPGSQFSPYPDALLDELSATNGDPAAVYDLHESIQLAFLAALQVLPPRQRAALILCDVVGYSAREVAELLDSTPASVNSALQRARSTLEQQRQEGHLHTGWTVTATAIEQSIVSRYVEAWDARDFHSLAALLKTDVVLATHPSHDRYEGRDAVAKAYASRMPPGPRARLVPTRANRQPALAVYSFDAASGSFRASGVFVLTLDGDAIAEIHAFTGPELPQWFGLPQELESGH